MALSPQLQRLVDRSRSDATIVAVCVGHGFYGCDTGCCGSEIHVVDAEGYEVDQAGFEFDHNYEDRLDEAREVAAVLGLPLLDNDDLRKKVDSCW